MNYWRRYAGDYQRDTGHLSLTEHGAYTMLLDHYYSKRSPLPVTLEALCRLCRATTTLEQQAVKAVADEFFRRAADGRRHNPRADREIAEWERLAQINRERGKLGGRPRRNPDENPPANPAGNPPGSFPETREVPKAQPAAKALQLQLQNPTPEPEPPSGVLEDSDSRPQERPPARRLSNGFHQEVIDAYHELLPDLPRVKVWTKKRRQALDARIRERRGEGRPADGIEYWRLYFAQVANSDFLCGRGRTDFRADLEWLLSPENFTKVIEGRYSNRRPANGVSDHAR